MIGTATYLLDANVFIEAAKRYYAFDIAPRFWDALVEHANDDSVTSIDRVKEELVLGNDDLAEWANRQFHERFAATDEDEVVKAFAEIMSWVNEQAQFNDAAKQEFASGADGWLVAYAKVNGCVVVTHEQFNPDIKRKVPIPNICRAFQVTCCDTFDMLRKLGVQLG
ncbi:MAG TPA: DUF4411 family protein [Armatimonadota bacterium]|nr:DUF4411 family protein [Armatimonadota bacterium]